MGRLRLLVFLILVVLVTSGIAFLYNRPARPVPEGPPGSFSIAVLGDAPYYAWEEIQYRRMLRQIDASDLEWVLHVGDIFWHPCTDDMYRSRLAWFRSLRHPLIYTPGDNEWFDCHETGSGAYAPLDRLNRIRQIFFADPTKGLGGVEISLASQGGTSSYGEFVENLRWEHRGVVFATVHLIGSRNGMRPFPKRTPADDAASTRRTEAAIEWMRAAFAIARQRQARSVVIGFHADPRFELDAEEPDRKVFEPFMTVLADEAAEFSGPVLLAHGDGHEYTVDHPLVRRSDGHRLANVTRLEVPGSPQVGWIRVAITPDAPDPFRFDAYIVPRWKYW
jgi:hypothetical protein